MAFDLATVRKEVEALLQDDATFLQPGERDLSIDSALRQVNHDRPRRLVFDITGDGTQDYDLGSDFQKAFSLIQTVEHPAGENPPVFRREEDDWILYEDPSKTAGQQLRLRFRTVTPKTTETIRVTITTPYVLTLAATTIDSQTIFQAIIYKTMVALFRGLASRFGQTTDSSIAADAVDYGGRTQNFLFLAERYETNYKSVIGVGENTKAAFALMEVDIVFDHGEDFLMHSARSR